MVLLFDVCIVIVVIISLFEFDLNSHRLGRRLAMSMMIQSFYFGAQKGFLLAAVEVTFLAMFT